MLTMGDNEIKLKYRLCLDAILFLVIWPVMEYHLSGNLVHEILGLALIGGFVFHMLLSRKYYVVMVRNIFSHNEIKTKNALAFMISKDLFVFANTYLQYLWRTVEGEKY